MIRGGSPVGLTADTSQRRSRIEMLVTTDGAMERSIVVYDVTTVLDSISKALADGHRVELRGFGAFSVKVRPSRMGRNPRTGEPVSVGQKRAPFFRTGKELRERLNGGTPEA